MGHAGEKLRMGVVCQGCFFDFLDPPTCARLLGPFIDDGVRDLNGADWHGNRQLVSLDGHDPLQILAIPVGETTPVVMLNHRLRRIGRNGVRTESGERPLNNGLVLLGGSFYAVVGCEFR